MDIATGLASASSHPATPDLATEAVAQAMSKAGLTIANSVLLFLTPEFAKDPQPALRAASKAANCMQVVGCTAAGIFTEQEWVLDAPAAAAMVFGGNVNLAAATEPGPEDLILSLTAPSAINTAWLADPGVRFGGVSGDATGQGPFKVWHGSKVSTGGRCESYIRGASGVVGVSQGIRPLTEPMEITQVNGYDVLTLRQQPALNVLARELPLEIRDMERLPLHLIMAGITFGDPATAIAEGRFHLTPIISTNSDDGSVTLAKRLEPGEQLFWSMRQPLAAERDMRMTIERLDAQLGKTPDFGLLFPCMGRGPYFYGGEDRDWSLFRQRYPGIPLIGFYGNGEIGPLNQANQIFQYSAVLGLFAQDV
jgi:small ligand-binding sensory domain FIST